MKIINLPTEFIEHIFKYISYWKLDEIKELFLRDKILCDITNLYICEHMSIIFL